MLTRTLFAGLLSALAAAPASALDPITIKGSKFFYENGTQFFIKGVAYQQDTSASGAGVNSANFRDPLADAAACRRDVPLLQELGTNAIRTYAIDPTADHTVCMSLLEDAGIYVISDLGEPRLSIETDSPLWDIDLFARYKAVIDELSRYDNVIGFFAGNEVTTNSSNTQASAYVKAAVRDTKSYIKKQRRRLYVGYAANDDADVRRDIAHYFNCGTDQGQAIDFWGYNIYQWCGESSVKKSGYDEQIDFFSNYSVPVFFAEYGCNTGKEGAEGRIWQETTAIYEEPMTDVFSGGIAYMYFQERNDYGLVELDGSNVTRMENFEALADRIAEVDPPLIDKSDYRPTNKPQECPPLSDTWQVAAPALPPTPDEKTCECMFADLSCVPVPGLDEDLYGDIFDYICDAEGNLCSGINGDAAEGEYGPFSMCNSEQKLGHVLDRYYKGQGRSEEACDFRGQATPVTPEERSDECDAALSVATQGAEDEEDGAVGMRVRGLEVGIGVVVAVVVWGML